MAIFHMSAKVVSRSAGSSGVAAAAYRSGTCLPDERLGRDQDFSKKQDVIYSKIMLPNGAPERLADRATLWNEVEAGEKRYDAQIAREIEFAIPREMGRQDGIELARAFVAQQFVARAMIADLNVHWDKAKDGSPKPHAHVMLTMREVGPNGFGKKVREWNAASLLVSWREAWAAHVNQRMAELGYEGRIDHRSYAEQGIALEPQHKIGPAGARREERGEAAERAADHRRIARENGENIIADSSVGLAGITRQQATFTNRELAAFVFRHSDGTEQFASAMRAMRRSPELVSLGMTEGEQRFTSREMIAVEARLMRAGEQLAATGGFSVGEARRDAALASSARAGIVLSGEQRIAFERVTGDASLAMVVGYAGTGKSAMLGAAREAWEAAGFQVCGAALSGIAAENLAGGSGIASRTIASLEYAWARGRDTLGRSDVLVIDEAAMIGTRQLERVLSAVQGAGAKAVLVGDAGQLQAIEAGAAFRALTEGHGAAEITTVRRQREAWQQQATRAFASGRAGEALEAYGTHGMVRAAATREDARAALIATWDAERRAAPDETRIILTHTNDEVQALNEEARERLRAGGELGADVAVTVERGERTFAVGDRIMFLRNDRVMEVRNGTLGTIERLSEVDMSVELDNGDNIGFDLQDYAHLDHGYAATIHKAQGVTVDRAHVLASPGLDRHATYTAMSRHRDGALLHYGRDEFTDARELSRVLSRDRAKDMAGDHVDLPIADAARTFGERREIRWIERARAVMQQARQVVNSMRRPQAASKGAGEEGPSKAQRAVIDYARIRNEIETMHGVNLEPLPHQETAFEQAHDAIEALRPRAVDDIETVFANKPELMVRAIAGDAVDAVKGARALSEERSWNEKVQVAETFVRQWGEVTEARNEARRDGDQAQVVELREMLENGARFLDGTPGRAAMLEEYAAKLGIDPSRDRPISERLIATISPDRTPQKAEPAPKPQRERQRDIGLDL